MPPARQPRGRWRAVVGGRGAGAVRAAVPSPLSDVNPCPFLLRFPHFPFRFVFSIVYTVPALVCAALVSLSFPSPFLFLWTWFRCVPPPPCASVAARAWGECRPAAPSVQPQSPSGARGGCGTPFCFRLAFSLFAVSALSCFALSFLLCVRAISAPRGHRRSSLCGGAPQSIRGGRGCCGVSAAVSAASPTTLSVCVCGVPSTRG